MFYLGIIQSASIPVNSFYAAIVGGALVMLGNILVAIIGNAAFKKIVNYRIGVIEKFVRKAIEDFKEEVFHRFDKVERNIEAFSTTEELTSEGAVLLNNALKHTKDLNESLVVTHKHNAMQVMFHGFLDCNLKELTEFDIRQRVTVYSCLCHEYTKSHLGSDFSFCWERKKKKFLNNFIKEFAKMIDQNNARNKYNNTKSRFIRLASGFEEDLLSEFLMALSAFRKQEGGDESNNS
jgi:hypothetical protein